MEFDPEHSWYGIGGATKNLLDLVLKELGYPVDVVIQGRRLMINNILNWALEHPAFEAERGLRSLADGFMGTYKYAMIVRLPDDHGIPSNEIWVLSDEDEFRIVDTSVPHDAPVRRPRT